MDEELLLTVLRQDLRMSPSEKPYLRTLLENAEALTERMGIQDDEPMGYRYTIERYVALSYRKHASSETIMLRFLHYGLNNLLFSQRTREWRWPVHMTMGSQIPAKE